MFKEHNYVIWGDYCSCGKECFIMQNKVHPWGDDIDFKIRIECVSCGKKMDIDKEKAQEFYSRKILSYYNDVEGKIIDLGCGGGFLSDFLLHNEKVSKIYAIDNDISCKDDIEKLNNGEDKISFINMDICDLNKYFVDLKVDYLVSRDVFMFIEDTQKYFDDITKIVSKGIRQMGWYVSNSNRMKNKLLPEQIVNELTKRNWQVRLDCLDWYKSGYFIQANR